MLQSFTSWGLGIAFGLAAALGSGAALAQSWPSKPITAVVVFAPGGTADGMARIVTQRLATELGQPVNVENRPGGGGTVGAASVVRAEPDGHTLLMLVSSHTVAETLFRNRRYELQKDLLPVSLIGTSPYWLLVNPASTPAARGVDELLATARAQPGKLSFASGGIGGLTHLAAEMLKSQAKVDIVHIPYKGNAPALTDLMAGRVDFIFDQPLSSEPFVKAGKLKPLAVTSRQRLPGSPDVPTMIEAGFAGFEVTAWFAVAAPAGTPAAIVQRLNQALAAVLAAPEVRKQLETAGVTPGASTPEELGALIRSEIPRWRNVIEQAQIKVE